MRSTFLSCFAVALSLLTGCASIVSGHNQPLSVETRQNGVSVSDVNCTLTNGKGTWYVKTPGSVTVSRSAEDLSVRCEKEGIEPGITSVKSTTKAMAFGNILFGGIIGVGVDTATGAAFDYPTLISVEMGAAKLIGAVSSAQVTSEPQKNP